MRNEHYYNQYYYSELIDAIKRRQYKDIVFKLRKLGTNAEPFNNNEDHTDLINKNRLGCMRGILYIFKNQDDYGLTGKDFLDVVKGARKVGINWPELDILEQSAVAQPADISLWDDDEVDESAVMSNTQSEINAHYEDLIADLDDDIYDDVGYFLQWIGRKGKPTTAAPSGFFNKHKLKMLKRIMAFIRYADEYDLSTQDLQHLLKGARNIGLEWPELDVLETSIGTDTINEAARTITIDVAVKDINGLFDGVARESKTLERLVLLYSTLADADHLSDVTDITALINSYKRQIIKDMLYNMKHGSPRIAIHLFINTLRRFGISWPELAVIEQSQVTKVNETTRIHLKDPRERMLDRLEFIFNDPGTDVFDRVTELDIAGSVLRRISQADVDAILKKYRTSIIRDTLSYMRVGVVHIDFPVFVRLLRDLGANWPELDVIASTVNKPKQLGEARSHEEIIQDGFDYDIFHGISALRIYGHQLSEFPEYQQLVSKHRSGMIRSLLQLCKDDKFGMAKFRAEDLQTVGVDWPELNIILDSTKHELAKFFDAPATNRLLSDELDEGYSSSTKYTLSGVLSSIEHDEPRELVLFLSQLAWADDLPHLSVKLQPHKRFIIKALLDFLRDESDDAEPVDTVRDCLTALKKIGFSSPELDILHNSLDIKNNGDHNG
jgi:hypothetical protein